MGLSLRNLTKKVVDQINPLDNGRTASHPAPTNNRSVIGQLTHNSITNIPSNTLRSIKAAPIGQLVQHGISGFTSSLNDINKSYKVDHTPAGHIKYNPAIGNSVIGMEGFGRVSAKPIIKTPVLAPKSIPIPVIDKSAPASRTVTSRVPIKTATSHDELINRYNDHMAELGRKYTSDQKAVTLPGKPGRQAIHYEDSIYNDVNYAAEKQKIQKMFKDGTLPKRIPVTVPQSTVAKVVNPGKQEVRLKKIESIKSPTKSQQIEEAVLREKTGKAPFEKAPSVAKMTPGSVNGFDIAARESQNVLKKIDPRLSEGVHQRREIGETTAAIAKNNLKVANTLSKAEQTNMARAIKGTEEPMNSKVIAAAREVVKEMDRAYALAEKHGVAVPGKRDNYFPQIHNPKNFQEGSKGFKDAVDHLVKTGQAKDGAQAIEYLRRFRNNTTMSPYKNLTEHRELDLPGYAENIQAVHRYLDRAYGNIAHAKVFGPKEEKLNQIFDEIRANGGNIEQAMKSYQQASGLVRGSDLGERLSSIATNAQGATKLGLSSVGNVTQKSNNAIVGGVGREVKAMATQYTKKNKEFIAKTGVRDEQVAHEALFGEQGVSKRMRGVTAPGFERIEKSNRGEAALVGRDQAQALAKKAAKGDVNAARKLRDDFGLSVPKDGVLSEADQIRAARSFVERTQFRTGPQDLPGWASTPGGRVVSQFRRYPYKQAQFLKREVIDKVRQGDPMPLVRTLAVGAPIGIASQTAVGKIRGGSFDQSDPEKALDTVNDATGSSLATSLPQSLYPGSHDGNSYVTKVVKALGGPTVSDATKAVQAGFEATKGKVTNAERFALQHVPVVGTPASNRVLPYAGSKKTDTGGSKPAKELTIEQMNARAKTETADFKKNMKPGGQGLQKLSDGSYIYQTGNDSHTAKDLRKAQDAIAKYSFEHSDAQDKTLRGTYYYKDGQGKTQSMPEPLHQYNLKDSKNSLDMDSAYRSSDWDKWSQLADKQLQVLEDKKKYFNPNTQQDKIDDLTNRQNDLIDKAEGYAEKIVKGKGFGKSGGSGSGSSKSTGSAYKYAVSSNAGRSAAAPKITVSVSGGGAKRAVARKASRPKVSLKKSNV